MKLKKRIAAMGAAVMMAVSMMSVNASALFKTWENGTCRITSYTSATSSNVYSNGSVINKSGKAKYSIKTEVYYITTGNKYANTANNLWKTATLSKNSSLSGYQGSTPRYLNYKYSSYTQVMRSNAPYKTVQSDYAKI